MREALSDEGGTQGSSGVDEYRSARGLHLIEERLGHLDVARDGGGMKQRTPRGGGGAQLGLTREELLDLRARQLDVVRTAERLGECAQRYVRRRYSDGAHLPQRREGAHDVGLERAAAERDQAIVRHVVRLYAAVLHLAEDLPRRRRLGRRQELVALLRMRVHVDHRVEDATVVDLWGEARAPW